MSATWYEIPLTSLPQTFQINLNGTNYEVTLYWNEFLNDGEGNWQLDLANADTSTPLIAGAPLVTGADILAGLDYLGIGGSLVVYTQGDPDATPSFTNLGSNSNLYFVSSEAAA